MNSRGRAPKIPPEDILALFKSGLTLTVWDVSTYFGISYRDAWRYLDRLKWKNHLKSNGRVRLENGYMATLYIFKEKIEFPIGIPPKNKTQGGSIQKRKNLPLADLSLIGQFNAVLKSNKRRR